MNDETTNPPSEELSTTSEEELKWPVSFMVILALAAIYVGWRLIQMIGNVIG